jgi:hypothetical protein
VHLFDYFQLADGPAPVLPQYFAVLLGIIAEPFFNAYRTTGGFGKVKLSIGLLVFSVIVACLILPAVYKNAFDPDKPLFVQLCAIFAAGVGWQTLLASAQEGRQHRRQAPQFK